MKKVPIFMPHLTLDVKFKKGLQGSFLFLIATHVDHMTVLSNHICMTKYIELDNYKLSCHNKREDKTQQKMEADNSPSKEMKLRKNLVVMIMGVVGAYLL